MIFFKVIKVKFFNFNFFFFILNLFKFISSLSYFLDYEHTVRPRFFIGFGMLPLFSYHASLAVDYNIYKNTFIQLSSFIAFEPLFLMLYDNPPAFFNLSLKYYFKSSKE